MRNPHLQQLRAAVRSEILSAFELYGYARPRDVAKLVCLAHPEQIAAIGQRLAEDALTQIARRELKREQAMSELPAQLALPALPTLGAERLPPSISVPRPGVSVDGAIDEEDLVFKPLAQATLADLAAHLSLLAAQIDADSRRHRALKELYDWLIAHGADTHTSIAVLAATAKEPAR
mgnify:FL=1